MTCSEHKQRITFAQAQAAHARGVEVWVHGVDIEQFKTLTELKWLYPLADECWTYALDRTPGRALTYDEACVHHEFKLPVEGRRGDCWFNSTGPCRKYAYRVALAVPAKEPAAEKQHEYVTGIRNMPEGTETEWEAIACCFTDEKWHGWSTWNRWFFDTLLKSRFRRPVKKREPRQFTFQTRVTAEGNTLNALELGVGTDVSVTVRELLSGTPPEPNWQTLYEQTRDKLSSSMTRIEDLKGERIAAQAALVVEREPHEKTKRKLLAHELTARHTQEALDALIEAR